MMIEKEYVLMFFAIGVPLLCAIGSFIFILLQTLIVYWIGVVSVPSPDYIQMYADSSQDEALVLDASRGMDEISYDEIMSRFSQA